MNELETRSVRESVLSPEQEQLIESKIEQERETFIGTIEDIRKDLGGLEGLSDENIEELSDPDIKDKISAVARYAMGHSYIFLSGTLGVAGAGYSMIGSEPSIEKTLIALGVGAATATVAGITEWLTGRSQKLFEGALSEQMKSKIYKASEKKLEQK